MQVASKATVLAQFDSSRFNDRGVTSTFFQRDGQHLVNTDGADGKNHDFPVAFTFGVSPLQQYLVRFPDGRMQPLPVAWDSRPAASGGQRWFSLTSGPRVAHGDEFHWTGRQQNWNYGCADCHSTGVEKKYDAQTDGFQTTWAEIDVSCESCHGPASAHVKWAGYPALIRRFWTDTRLQTHLAKPNPPVAVTPAIVRPAVSTPAEEQVCAQCHSRRDQIAEGYTAGAPLLDHYVPSTLLRGLFHADGQQREEVYTYASFLQSRMHKAGVTCANCHDPHSARLRLQGNALCTQCHVAAKYDTTAHHFHQTKTAGAACVSCHMPATTYMQIDARRDHSLRVPRPDQSVAYGVPNACNSCHTDRDARWAAARVRDWYGHDPAGFQRFAAAFAADERDAPAAPQALSDVAHDSTEPAIVRASALARLANRPGDIAFAAARASIRDSSALVRRAALQILEAAPVEERPAVASALLTDSLLAVRLEAAWTLAPALRVLDSRDSAAFARAASEFENSQRLHAERAENRVTLGIFLAEIGRVADAEAEYRAAIRIGPTFAPAYVNLADLLRGRGDEVGTERVLRDGLAALPNDATLRHALGLTFARAHRTDDATRELGRAVSLDSSDARFAYVYAVALAGAHRIPAALAVLEKARAVHPHDHDLLIALASTYRDAGNRAKALQYARLLIDVFPQDRDALALLRSLER